MIEREKLLKNLRIGRLQAVRAIVIHHSATPLDATFESIERHHTHSNMWHAIGYHFVIDGEALLRHGRPLPLVGAHAPPRNSDTIGLCIVGNNADQAQRWTREQILVAQVLIVDLRTVFGQELEVLAHCEVGATACPGMSRAELLALFGL